MSKQNGDLTLEDFKRLFGLTSERWYALNLKDAEKKALKRIDYISLYYKAFRAEREKCNFSKDFFSLMYYINEEKNALISTELRKAVLKELESFVSFYTDHSTNIFSKPATLKFAKLPNYIKMVDIVEYSNHSLLLSHLLGIRRISAHYQKRMERTNDVNMQAAYISSYIEQTKFLEDFLTLFKGYIFTNRLTAYLIRYDFKLPKKYWI